MVEVLYRSLRDRHTKKLAEVRRGAYVRLVTTDTIEVNEFAATYKLESDLLRDGIDLYESPRLEKEGQSVYIFTRYCNPEGELTSTDPLLIISGPENVFTVARSPSTAIESVLASGDMHTTQKTKFILQILRQVNRGYRHYINQVTKQIFATRSRLQKTIISNDDVLVFIDIEEDLNEFLAALQPYSLVLSALMSGKYMSMHEEDKDLIEDLMLSTNELIDLTKSRLKTMQNIREAYTTIATNNLNKIFKRLTSITIFLMIPTIISGFYGMNVVLPLKDNPQAFSLLVVLALSLIALAILFFRHRRWL